MVYINKENFNISDPPERFEEQKFFEVDDFIASSISLLNKKGYITSLCCSGHPFERLARLWVSFNDNYNFNRPLPKDFYYFKKDEVLFICYNYKNLPDSEEILNEILETNLAFCKWVKELEDRSVI